MSLRHFQVFFNVAGKKNYLFLFPSKTHKKFPSQEDKISWFPSQLQSEQPGKQKNDNFLHRTSKWTWLNASNITFSVWGGGPNIFKVSPAS